MAHAALAENALIDHADPGVAVSGTSLPSRSTRNVIGSPVLMSVASCRPSKLTIGSPSTDLTRSPGWKPAAAAGLFASTRPMRAMCSTRPKAMKKNVKITNARMKLATGPASTIAARLATGWAASVLA